MTDSSLNSSEERTLIKEFFIFNLIARNLWVNFTALPKPVEKLVGLLKGPELPR